MGQVASPLPNPNTQQSLLVEQLVEGLLTGLELNATVFHLGQYWDLIGATVCLLGMAIIMLGPRADAGRQDEKSMREAP
jgi:hypothetical protein